MPKFRLRVNQKEEKAVPKKALRHPKDRVPKRALRKKEFERGLEVGEQFECPTCDRTHVVISS